MVKVTVPIGPGTELTASLEERELMLKLVQTMGVRAFLDVVVDTLAALADPTQDDSEGMRAYAALNFVEEASEVAQAV